MQLKNITAATHAGSGPRCTCIVNYSSSRLLPASLDTCCTLICNGLHYRIFPVNKTAFDCHTFPTCPSGPRCSLKGRMLSLTNWYSSQSVWFGALRGKARKVADPLHVNLPFWQQDRQFEWNRTPPSRFTGRLQCFWKRSMGLVLASHLLHHPHSDVIIPCRQNWKLQIKSNHNLNCILIF